HVGMVRRCGCWENASPPCSPRTWGWSVEVHTMAGYSGVLPTHVGMVRAASRSAATAARAPHARGDGPEVDTLETDDSGCSPRTWGWSASRRACTCLA